MNCVLELLCWLPSNFYIYYHTHIYLSCSWTLSLIFINTIDLNLCFGNHKIFIILSISHILTCCSWTLFLIFTYKHNFPGTNGRCNSPDFKKICVANSPDGKNVGSMTADLVIANYGQHPADGAHRWKYSKYRSSIDAYINKLKAKGTKKVRQHFLWMETVASMFRKDSWVRGYKDWRTNGRLGMYNKYATKKMRELGVGVLPVWRQSMSMTRLNPDMAHLEKAILHSSTVQQILNFLCPDGV